MTSLTVMNESYGVNNFNKTLNFGIFRCLLVMMKIDDDEMEMTEFEVIHQDITANICIPVIQQLICHIHYSVAI